MAAYCEVSDVERMVGDLVTGRRFLDYIATDLDADPKIRGQSPTNPTRSEVETLMERAADQLNAILTDAYYVIPVGTSDTEAHSWIIEVNSALTSARLLGVLPIRERENVRGERGELDSRISLYQGQVTDWITAVKNGRFPATRNQSPSPIGGADLDDADSDLRNVGV